MTTAATAGNISWRVVQLCLYEAHDVTVPLRAPLTTQSDDLNTMGVGVEANHPSLLSHDHRKILISYRDENGLGVRGKESEHLFIYPRGCIDQ